MTINASQPGEIAISKRLEVGLGIAGVSGAAVTCIWALAQHDQLVTPKGSVTVSFTTATVMLLFFSVISYWRKCDRERKLRATAAQAESEARATMERARMLSLLEQVVGMLATGRGDKEIVRAVREEVANLRAQLGGEFGELIEACRPKPRTRRKAPPKKRNDPPVPVEESDYILDIAAEAFRMGRESRGQEPPEVR